MTLLEYADADAAIAELKRQLEDARADSLTAATLIRMVCSCFDSGGESQRSVRARLAEAAFSLLHRDEPAFWDAYARQLAPGELLMAVEAEQNRAALAQTLEDKS